MAEVCNANRTSWLSARKIREYGMCVCVSVDARGRRNYAPVAPNSNQGLAKPGTMLQRGGIARLLLHPDSIVISRESINALVIHLMVFLQPLRLTCARTVYKNCRAASNEQWGYAGVEWCGAWRSTPATPWAHPMRPRCASSSPPLPNRPNCSRLRQRQRSRAASVTGAANQYPNYPDVRSIQCSSINKKM